MNVDGDVWPLAQLQPHLGQEAYKRLAASIARATARTAAAALGGMREAAAKLGTPPDSCFELLGESMLVLQHAPSLVQGPVLGALSACALSAPAPSAYLSACLPLSHPPIQLQHTGLDYLVDSSGHPWLLEVNATPSLAVEHACTDTLATIYAQVGCGQQGGSLF